MKKILPLILFIAISSLNAQADTDSLWTLWNNESLDDTVRIDAMNDLAWGGYLFSKPDSAFILAQKAHDLAKKTGYKKKMAAALNTQGASYWVRGIHSKALEYFNMSFEVYDEEGDLGNSATCLNNMGIIYRSQGNNLKGLQYLLKSLHIREELKDTNALPAVLNNIGLIYQDQEDYENALLYYQRSLEIRESIDDKKSMAGSLNNVGLILQIRKNYPDALDYFNRSLAINREMADRKGEANSLNNIGLLFKEQDNIEEALTYFEESMAISTEIGDSNGIANSNISMGQIQYARGNYLKASNECAIGLDIAEKIGDVLMQKDACNCLFLSFKEQGNSSKALEFHEKLMGIEENLQQNEISGKLQEMEFNKQVVHDSIAQVEKDRIVKSQHQDELYRKNRTKNIAFVVGFVILILALALYSRLRYVRKSKKIIENEKDRSENLLLNILPFEVAEELKAKGKSAARDFEMVSILFTDFISFTETSEHLTAKELVEEINVCFETFDDILEKHKVEKIKTIGDAYMAAGGLPVPTDDSVKNTVLAALEMQDFISKRKAEMDAADKPAFEMRVGIHTGPVVAGIVGVKKFQSCIKAFVNWEIFVCFKAGLIYHALYAHG